MWTPTCIPTPRVRSHPAPRPTTGKSPSPHLGSDTPVGALLTLLGIQCPVLASYRHIPTHLGSELQAGLPSWAGPLLGLLTPSACPFAGYLPSCPALGSLPAWTSTSPHWASAPCVGLPLCGHTVLILVGLPHPMLGLPPSLVSAPLNPPVSDTLLQAPHQHGHPNLTWLHLKASEPNVQEEEGCLILFKGTNNTLPSQTCFWHSFKFICLWKDGSLTWKITFIL